MKRSSSRPQLNSAGKQDQLAEKKKSGTKFLNFLRKPFANDGDHSEEFFDSTESIAKAIQNKRDMSKTYIWSEKIYEGKAIYVMKGKRTDGKKVIGKFLNTNVYKKKMNGTISLH